MQRREFTQLLVALLASIKSPSLLKNNATQKLIVKTIPSSKQKLAVMGMGSSRSFNVTNDLDAIALRIAILKSFFELGGSLIDSSPMYGHSEQVIGRCLEQLSYPQSLFSATKVWTTGKQAGVEQMQQSLKLWGLQSFDLMQIHNLVDWKTQLKTLRQWKEKGLIKYIGLTTSHGMRHSEMIEIINKESFDFVQFSYNIRDREAEKYLLPLAYDKGIAVIVNRPFKGLFSYSKGKPLPDFAQSIGCDSWAQFYLKFVISHSAVTCVIPATSKLKHMRDNMQAGFGDLADEKLRQEMSLYFQRFI